MTTEVTLAPPYTLANIERGLTRLRFGASRVVIALPTASRREGRHFGGTALLLQLLSTARQLRGADGVTFTRPVDSADLAKEVVLAAALLGFSSAAHLRQEADVVANQRTITAGGLPLRGGRTILYWSSLTPLAGARLYDTEGALGTIYDSAALLRAFANPNRFLFTEELDEVSSFFHELFGNTHHWGRTDLSGQPVPCGLRYVVLNVAELPANGQVNWFEAGSPLGRYCAAAKARRYLEVVVGDNGPGIASRMCGSPSPGLDAERQALEAAFEKHRSSAGDGHRGMGLYRATLALSALRAFLLLRTGRMSLFQDLSESIFAFQRFEAWPTRVGSSYAVGTTFTIVIPMSAP